MKAPKRWNIRDRWVDGVQYHFRYELVGPETPVLVDRYSADRVHVLRLANFLNRLARPRAASGRKGDQ